jgi:hypothetical protein
MVPDKAYSTASSPLGYLVIILNTTSSQELPNCQLPQCQIINSISPMLHCQLSNWLHFASWQNDFQISFIIGYPMCNFVVQMCFCSFLFGAGRGKKGLQLATYLFMWCINLITCLHRLPTQLPNVPTYLTRLPINLLN